MGLTHQLQSPEEAFPPEQKAVSIEVAVTLRGTFSAKSIAVRTFFDALAMLLIRRDEREH